MTDLLLVEGVRTPRAKARESGALHHARPVELIASLYASLEQRVGPIQADDLLLGCVTQVGDQGTNVARLAALWAGIDAPGLTLNRFCTSGLDAIGLGAGKIAQGDGCVLVGGVEMPSRAGMFGDEGAWFADKEVATKTQAVHMGVSADLLATEHHVERAQLDAYALRSQTRAARANEQGLFKRRVATCGCEHDETIRPGTTEDSLAALQPAYAQLPGPQRDARHTLATSPALADGASLLVLASEDTCNERQWRPLAKLRGYASVSVDPLRMLHGNPSACRAALRRAGVQPSDVELWEVNESFAVVPILFQRELDVADERLNVAGGAIALGHPLGATGGVLTTMLLDSMEQHDATLGVVSICGGAGVATALVWERV